jgi:uncharacterized protein YbjT (DUF2867 family)
VHLVLSTVMRIDDEPTGVPHVDSKHEIERYLCASGVTYTLLRPGTFMDNIGARFFPVRPGAIRGFTDGDSKLPCVSCRDIGEAAANVFTDPGFRWSAPPKLLMRLFAREFYEMRTKIEQNGRPPYAQKPHVDEALRATRTVVPDAWGIEQLLQASGFVERKL